MKTYLAKPWLGGLSAALLSLLPIHAVHAQASYANGNPGDWADAGTGDPVSVTPVATGGPGGGAYTQISNVPDEYQSPGYGSGPYSNFGTGLTVSPGQSFYQSVDVYIDANWAAPNPSYAQSFWIDMAPNSSDNSTYYGAEHNFRLTATGSAVNVSVDGQSSPLASITTSGWYDFQMVYTPGATGTDPELTDLNILSVDGSGNPGTLLGTTTVDATAPGGPTQSQNVNGSGYVWFTVWTNGSADDTLNVAHVETATVPAPEPSTWALLLAGMALFFGLRRRRSRI